MNVAEGSISCGLLCEKDVVAIATSFPGRNLALSCPVVDGLATRRNLQKGLHIAYFTDASPIAKAVTVEIREEEAAGVARTQTESDGSLPLLHKRRIGIGTGGGTVSMYYVLSRRR